MKKYLTPTAAAVVVPALMAWQGQKFLMNQAIDN